MKEEIKNKLSAFPRESGVYFFKDHDERIVYIGKARDLWKRMRSYIYGQDSRPMISLLLKIIDDCDFIVTKNEKEALVLENNLIKKHRPLYNIDLKDDKTFPYLKIDPSEDWPRVCITRRLEEDGGRYFGPFASAKSMRQTLKTIKRIFPFRTCSKPVTGTDSRPCLWYYVGKCLAPCIGAVSKEEYAEVVKQVILFLAGKRGKVVQELESQMNKAAEALEFEKVDLIIWPESAVLEFLPPDSEYLEIEGVIMTEFTTGKTDDGQYLTGTGSLHGVEYMWSIELAGV